MELVVGGVVFGVEQVEGLHEEGVKLSGTIRYGDCVIRVEASDAPQSKWQTLWHEAMHALFRVSGRETEHGVVDMLGYGVIQVLRDNPWMAQVPVEFVVGGLEEGDDVHSADL